MTLNNQYKTIKCSVKFLSVFVKDLGGFKVFFAKAVEYFKSNGFSHAMGKSKYILLQAKIAGLNHTYTNEAPFEETDEEVIKHEYRLLIPDPGKLSNQIKTFSLSPLFSILMPTYNTNPQWLTEAIESVRNQIYPNWELCIADDASTNKDCIEVLKKYEKKDKRIKVVYRKENGHISNASNSALELATGDFIVLLDHDDKLSEDALFWMAKTINEQPAAKLIYSDEDKIDDKGIRKDPYFKCDWNYSLFLSQNFINHLGAYDAKLFKKIGGFRPGYEGSQDYDMVLRFIEHISPDSIVHIPRVLYHWRIHKNSTAYKADEKPYALIAAQKAIADHLKRKEINADVELLDNQMYRVKYMLPDTPPLVSIIIPTKDNFKILERCINSLLLKTDYNNYEILIVDNNSEDKNTLDYLQEIRKNEKVTVLKDKQKFNFSSINNKAVNHVNGSYLCFLNDDTEVISTAWLSEMVSVGVQQGVGVVGARLWYPNNTLQHGGVVLGIGGVASHSHKRIPKGKGGYFNRATLIQEFSAVTAACMLLPKKVFLEIDGFDEENLTVAFNDVDLCLSIREKGYRIVWTPYAELYHHESLSRGEDRLDEKNKRFFLENEFMLKKWKTWIENDPAYSPNLTLKAEDFSFAWPPRVDLYE